MASGIPNDPSLRGGINYEIRSHGNLAAVDRLFAGGSSSADRYLLTSIFVDIFRSRILPDIKHRVAVRTGRLQRTLNVEQRGQNIDVISGVEYGKFASFRLRNPRSRRRTNVIGLTLGVVKKHQYTIQREFLGRILYLTGTS